MAAEFGGATTIGGQRVDQMRKPMSGMQGKVIRQISFWPAESRLMAGALGWAIMAALYAVLALCILYPLAMILLAAFSENGIVAAVSKIFSSNTVAVALWNTILTSVIGVGIAGVIGVALAWLVGRTNMPFKRVLDPFNLIPFYISSVVGALCWQILASPRSGILNVWLMPIVGPGFFNIYTVWGIGFVLGLYYSPCL